MTKNASIFLLSLLIIFNTEGVYQANLLTFLPYTFHFFVNFLQPITDAYSQQELRQTDHLKFDINANIWS